jgi:hypothetical protein
MSKRIAVIFGGRAFDVGIKRTLDYHPGIDEVRVYDDRWLMQQPFYRNGSNAWLWDTPEKFGFGWCCWKPYIVLREMARRDDGDLILYLDADTSPVSDVSPLFDLCERSEQGIVLFEEQGCMNREFTRRACFEAMGRKLEDVPVNERHACGRFQIFRAEEKVGNFLMEWSVFNVHPHCQLRHGSEGGDQPEFKRNSAEQSVLSNLAAKHRIPLHRTPDQNGWPIQYGMGQEGDTYQQIFEQVWATGDRGDLSGSRFFNVEAR